MNTLIASTLNDGDIEYFKSCYEIITKKKKKKKNQQKTKEKKEKNALEFHHTSCFDLKDIAIL